MTPDLFAEALFCSPLQPSENPSPEVVRAAVENASERFGPVRCAELLAAEYGDHPGLAAERMGWCLAAVAGAYASAGVR
jgi:hypothetical protein